MTKKVEVTTEVKARNVDVKVKKTFGDKLKLGGLTALSLAFPPAAVALGMEIANQKNTEKLIRENAIREAEASEAPVKKPKAKAKPKAAKSTNTNKSTTTAKSTTKKTR